MISNVFGGRSHSNYGGGGAQLPEVGQTVAQDNEKVNELNVSSIRDCVLAYEPKAKSQDDLNSLQTQTAFFVVPTFFVDNFSQDRYVGQVRSISPNNFLTSTNIVSLPDFLSPN